MYPRLQPHILLRAYATGIFPLADERGRVYWFSPDPRAVLRPHECRLPRNARREARPGRFDIRVDTAFEQVIAACSHRPEGTWISRELTEAYCLLHELGFAHSVEAWHEGRLAGGLYGVALGAVFFGESMFHRVSGASNAALVWLIQRYRQVEGSLIDIQWLTPHLQAFGAVEVPRTRYLQMLAACLRRPACFLQRHEIPPDWIPWQPTPEHVLQEKQLLPPEP